MPALLVTYELKSSEMDYSTFHSMLHSYPWMKVTNSTVVVHSAESPQEFFDGIWPWVDQHDTVVITEINHTWTGICSDELRAWLKVHCESEPVAA
jgi:hypothetical protein